MRTENNDEKARGTNEGTQEDPYFWIEIDTNHHLTIILKNQHQMKRMRNIIGWLLIIKWLLPACAVSYVKALDTTTTTSSSTTTLSSNKNQGKDESSTSSNHLLFVTENEFENNSTDGGGGGGDSNSTSAPSSSSNATTHVPTISPAPTLMNKKNSTSSSPTMAPQPSPTGTSKPTRKYTHQPTASPTSTSSPTTQEYKHKSKKSIWRTFFTFVSWVFVTLVSLVVCGKCMSHRSQIYFWFMEMWYNLSNRFEHLNIGERLSNGWEFVKGISLGLYRRITRRNVAPTGVMDEDGSTMMQGLLMRENI